MLWRVTHIRVLRGRYPLVPGIDVAGTLRSAFEGYAAGTPVVATGNGLGESVQGGFATEVWAPPAAIIQRPESLSATAAMAMGTAGLTAILAVERLRAVIDWEYQSRIQQDDPLPWLVTGASGGVGHAGGGGDCIGRVSSHSLHPQRNPDGCVDVARCVCCAVTARGPSY